MICHNWGCITSYKQLHKPVVVTFLFSRGANASPNSFILLIEYENSLQEYKLQNVYLL